MSESNRDVELPRIKRKTDSWEGMVIRHLLSYPSKKPATELAMDALTPYWGVKGRELKSTGRKAIAQLMQQVELIRLECGLRPDEMPFGEWMRLSPSVVPFPGVVVPTAPAPHLVQTATAPVPAVVENTGDEDDGDESEDDDGFWDSEEDDPIAKAEIEVDAGFRLS
jgi:hypothetical protein